jgi:peptide/nickel transport system permease protein
MIRRVLSRPTGRIAVGILLMIAVLAVFGSVLAPDNPLANSAHPLAPISGSHWLGTDYLGRDTLSRLLAGSWTSVVGAIEVAVIALFVGAIPGVLSVYLGRVFEWVTLRLIDTLIALPFLLVAVAVTALLGNGITQALLVVGVLLAPGFYRVSRAAALSVARSQYVEAAQISGASPAWIVRRHVWNKVLPPISVSMAYTVGAGFIVVSSLSFLGIGVEPPAATWGGLLSSDLSYLSYQPWAPVAPAVLIVVTVWACNLLADTIRDVSGEAGRVRQRPAETPQAARSRARRCVMASVAGREMASAVAAPPAAGALLSVRGVHIRDQMADHEIVHGISFELAPGKAVGIVGESGSGKTLTCRAALGILPDQLVVSAGSITIAGHDIAGLSVRQWTELRGSTISGVFQDPASYLNPSIPAGPQIAEVIRVKKKVGRREARDRVLDLLRSVQLRNPENVYSQYTFELSGGMLQRVLIAAAIAADPRVLIADEATTALDVTVQAEILDLLADLRERTGLALLIVAHDLAVVAQVCDEVLVMRQGDVVEHGTTEDVLYRPQHEYTQLLISEHEQYGLERFLDAPREERS